MEMIVPPGSRIVSESDWSRLQEEVRLTNSRIGQTCDMCANYENSLQSLQKSYDESIQSKQSSEKSLGSYKEDLERESKYRKDMEEKWLEVAKDYEKQVSECQNISFRSKNKA